MAESGNADAVNAYLADYMRELPTKKTLIYTGGFVAILLLAYIFSSGAVEANASEEVKKASESVRKWTSTGLIALYILVAAAVAALIASNVKKALMK